MRTIARITGSLVLALAAASVPTGVALACSCAFPGYADAIAGADVAFIGTVVGASEPDGSGNEPIPEARYAFEVERSKAPMTSPFELSVAFGGDANCGFDMAVGETYLVIASEWDGRLTTSLCSGTTLTERMDRGELGRAEHALPATGPADRTAEPFRLDVPAPVAVGAGALVLIGLISLLAFRRDAR